MGVVFRGFDPSIARPVAIKVIRPQHLATPELGEEARTRFSREANAAGRLSHPNIVTIYQLGEDRGYQYMAMEYVDGAPLNKTMRGGVPMDPVAVLDLLRQAADGLDHAHEQGVVHRDIKPANIMVRPDGKIKIADFGIARVASQTLTRTGTTLGTPAYMAPEQIRGVKVDGRADQFSLAVLTYQMLAGQRPFEAPTEQQLIFEIMESAPKPIHELNPSLPVSCDAVLQRSLAKDPAARYASCGEFSRALAQSFVPEPKPAVVAKAAKSGLGKWLGAVFALAALAAVFFFAGRGQTPGAGTPVTPAVGAGTDSPAAAKPSLAKAAAQSVTPSRPVHRTSTSSSAAAPQDLKQKQAAETPEQTEGRRVREQKTLELEATRAQLKTQLDKAQRELDELRGHDNDGSPDLEAAASLVQKLRDRIGDITAQIQQLKTPAAN